ncbi:MAG: DUF2085 domain-containing protein [Caldilineaceae bacterium]|nr:DUF2085 domain-containing protein [Caldilineaceae bacterium]
MSIMLFFVLLPFLAPLFMALEWYGPGYVIYQLYAPFCHQLPQRSWFLFGENLTYTLDEISQVYSYTNAWELRSFVGTPEMGWKVAWSDRMISFYMMTPVFGLFYTLRRRMPKPIPFRLLLVTILPLFLDGTTHALNDLISGVAGNGFRDTNAWLALLTNQAFPGFYAGDHFGTFNWWMRLLTGILAAWGLAAFFFPWLDQLLRGEVTLQAKPSASRS